MGVPFGMYTNDLFVKNLGCPCYGLIVDNYGRYAISRLARSCPPNTGGTRAK